MIVAPTHDTQDLSRRRLLAGGLTIGTGVFAGSILLDVEAAEAKSVSDSTKRANGSVTVIGDSSVIFGLTGLKSELKARDLGPFRCDARPARTLGKSYKGVSTALSYVKSNRCYPAVVVALGGGDTGIFKHSSSEIRSSLNKLLDALGDREIGLSTQWSPRAKKYADRYNGALYDAASARGNVFVSDWASKVKANPQWFGVDDAHYKSSGIKARNKFLADMALKAAQRA
jgi:hypothetical protein